MSERPKLLLLIPHLGGGGAEQVMAQLAQHLSRDKFELHLALITQAGLPPDALGAGVTVHALGAARVRRAGPRVLALVRTLRPALILSGMFHLNFLVLLLRPLFPASTRIVVRQNGTISASLKSGGLPVYTRLLYRLLYRRADRVVCQSAAMADDMARELGVQPSRIAVLSNPIDVAAIRSAASAGSSLWPGPGPNLLAVGRLAAEKGFDLLLQALVHVREQFPGANLVLAGTGSEQAALQAQCRQLALESVVRFAGQVSQPAAYFAGAAAFVLSSRHEGMPNALLEAAAGGLPLIALPASQGVVDLLQGQPGAWLAETISAAALASALLTALAAMQPFQRFAHEFIDDFRLDRAIPAYEALLEAVLQEHAP